MTIANDVRVLGFASKKLGWLDVESLETEVATLLPQQTWSSIHGHSRLNPNGSPLKICISVENKKVSGQLIVDPCHYLQGEARFNGAWQAAFNLAERKAPSFIKTLQVTQKLMTTWCAPDDFINGPLWLATVPGSPGMAICFDAQPLKQHVAKHIENWLKAVAPASIKRFSELLKPNSGVSLDSFGIEGETLGNARVKVYFRLEPTTMLQSLGAQELYSTPMLAWLDKVIPNNEISPSGLRLSISAPIQPGGTGGAKIDICGHCVKHSLQQWDDIFAYIKGASGMPLLFANVNPEKVDVALAGFGVSTNMVARVNIYLRAVR